MRNIKNEKYRFKVKKNRFFLILFALLIISPLIGQTKVKFTEPLFIKGFNFYIDTVYVAQKEQKILGFHWLPNSKETYKFKKGKNISLGLQNLFDESFPDDGTKEPLTVRINKILYSANMVNETADIVLHISFLNSEGEKYYHLYTTSEVYFQKKIELGKTVFKIPEKLLREALTSCFNNFVDNFDFNDKKLVSKEELVNSVYLYQKELELLQNKGVDVRVFKNFNDFADNNSSVDDNLVLQKTEVRKGDFFYKVTHKDGAANDYLMVFDGKDYYINFESHFYKLTLSDKNSVSFLVPKNNNDGDFLAEILGLGTALGTGLVLRNNTDLNIVISSLISGVAGASVYFVSSVITKNIRRAYNYEFDLLTGHIFRIP